MKKLALLVLIAVLVSCNKGDPTILEEAHRTYTVNAEELYDGIVDKVAEYGLSDGDFEFAISIFEHSADKAVVAQQNIATADVKAGDNNFIASGRAEYLTIYTAFSTFYNNKQVTSNDWVANRFYLDSEETRIVLSKTTMATTIEP